MTHTSGLGRRMSVGLIVVAIFIGAFFLLRAHNGCGGAGHVDPHTDPDAQTASGGGFEIASAVDGVTIPMPQLLVATAVLGALLIAAGATLDATRWGILGLFGWATYFPLEALLPATAIGVFEWAHVAEVCSLLAQRAVEMVDAGDEGRDSARFTVVRVRRNTAKSSDRGDAGKVVRPIRESPRALAPRHYGESAEAAGLPA